MYYLILTIFLPILLLIIFLKIYLIIKEMCGENEEELPTIKYSTDIPTLSNYDCQNASNSFKKIGINISKSLILCLIIILSFVVFFFISGYIKNLPIFL